MSVQFRPARPSDTDALADLESRSYPADEAASRDTIAFRLANAPACFLAAIDGEHVVGFVCGTRARGARLTHASMAEHVPDGESLCIHSVVVEDSRRRTGLGSRMLTAYLAHLRAEVPEAVRALLICKEHLIGFYAAAGFELIGPSQVVHGQDPWFEMGQPLG